MIVLKSFIYEVDVIELRIEEHSLLQALNYQLLIFNSFNQFFCRNYSQCFASIQS